MINIPLAQFFKRNLALIIILSASIAISIFVNVLNLSYALTEQRKTGIDYTYKGITINSPDNEYYLNPVENYLDGKGWRQSPAVGKGSYFRRVPGYSIVYFTFRNFLNIEDALKWMKVFQFTLFVISIILFYRTLQLLKANKWSAVLLSLLYGSTPFFSSYTFYTLTESVSPFLVVYSIYFLVAALKGNSKRALTNFVLASFFIGYGTMTRPYLGALLILIAVIPWQYYKDYAILSRVGRVSIVLCLPIIMLISWAVRNYIITKEMVLLEVAYYPENLDRMKPEFKAFWNFTRCWAEDGSVMNSYHLPFYFATLRGDTSRQYIDNIIQSVPADIQLIVSQDKIRKAILDYRRIILEQRKYFANTLPMPQKYSELQIAVAEQFDDLTRTYKKSSPITYYVLNPLKYLRDLTLHSNTSNLLIFQSSYRDKNFGINLFRYILLAVHIMLYVSILINTFYYRGDFASFLMFSFIPLFFIAFFTLIIQAIEQRYMLPILPIVILSNYKVLDILFLKIRGKFKYLNIA